MIHDCHSSVESFSSCTPVQVRRVLLLLPWLLGGLLGPGCMVGPDYRPPEVDMPDAWHLELTGGLTQGKAQLESWWTLLNDPVLDDFIARAAAGNLDLREAFERILEARSLLGIAKGEHFPDVDATGVYERSRLSEGVFESTLPGESRTDNFYQAGIDASWELDLWGRIRRSIESADASLAATTRVWTNSTPPPGSAPMGDRPT